MKSVIEQETYLNGDTYHGFVCNGLRHGYGKYVWKAQPGDHSKSFYLGEWVRGEKSGPGMMQFADGAFYNGEWKNDMQHGKGKNVWERKPEDVFLNFYDGDWAYSTMTGQGKR